MANFSKYVLGTLPITPSASANGVNGSGSGELPRISGRRSLRIGRSPSFNVSLSRRLSTLGRGKKQASLHVEPEGSPQTRTPPEPNGQLPESPLQMPDSPGRTSIVSSESSTSDRKDSSATTTERVRLAGDSSVYIRTPDSLISPFVDNMIRERVSTRGVIRPLEPESELPSCTMPLDRIGVANELVLRRYIEGSTKWNEKFAKTKEHIRKQRAHSFKLAKNDAALIVPQLQTHFFLHAEEVEGENKADDEGGGNAGSKEERTSIEEGLKPSAASWAWAWALDNSERPPPSSIVARRDTEEARRLSKIADSPSNTHDHRVSGNNLWSYLVNRLSLERNEAKVEQRAVERDPKDVGEDVSYDTKHHQRKDKGKEKDRVRETDKEKAAERHGEAPKERTSLRLHWPRSLSRSASRARSSDKRGGIFRLRSSSAVRPEVQANGNNAELAESNMNRVKSN